MLLWEHSLPRTEQTILLVKYNLEYNIEGKAIIGFKAGGDNGKDPNCLHKWSLFLPVH